MREAGHSPTVQAAVFAEEIARLMLLLWKGRVPMVLTFQAEVADVRASSVSPPDLSNPTTCRYKFTAVAHRSSTGL
jgi:hypothetical protein